jgi:hypothetical protein
MLHVALLLEERRKYSLAKRMDLGKVGKTCPSDWH